MILNTTLLFARVTLDVQIKIATMDTFRCNIMFIFSNLILIISLFIKNSTYNFYFLACTAIFKFAELAVFIYFRAKEITDFLEIRIFCVKPADSSDMVKV